MFTWCVPVPLSALTPRTCPNAGSTQIFEMCLGGELFEPIADNTIRLSERQSARLVSAPASSGRLVDGWPDLLLADPQGHRGGAVPAHAQHRPPRPQGMLTRRSPRTGAAPRPPAPQPENILLKTRGIDSEIQLIDFGLATEVKPGETLRRHVGTPYYIAPEVLDKSYTHTADVWSVGVILYTLLCSAPPFFGDSEREIYRRIRTAEVSFDGQEWESRSMQAKSLVFKLLQKVSSNRPSLDEVLVDPWIIQEGDMSSDPTDPRTFARLFARLRRYGVFPRLKRFVMLHVAMKQAALDARVSRERSFFSAIDKDNDGVISVDDLHSFFSEQEAELPLSEVEWIVQGMSMRKGAASPALFPEFVAVVMPRSMYLRESTLLHEFAYFDRDSNGFIDDRDFAEATGLPLEEATAIIDEAELGQGVRSLDMSTFATLLCGSERDAF